MRSPPAEVATARTIVGASAIGQGHVHTGLPCQDDFAWAERDNAFVIAVADGLGSASRSDIGAAFATEAAATRALSDPDEEPPIAAFEGMRAAREALDRLAAADEHPVHDLACTLMVVVAGPSGVGIAHIGDGAVVGVIGEATHVLSPPAASEYLNVVDPLTAPDWENRTRVVSCLPGLEALALFTDGCQHAALRRSGTRHDAHPGFFDPLFAFVRTKVATSDANSALERLLAGSKMGEHSDDDKTLVLAVLR